MLSHFFIDSLYSAALFIWLSDEPVGDISRAFNHKDCSKILVSVFLKAHDIRSHAGFQWPAQSPGLRSGGLEADAMGPASRRGKEWVFPFGPLPGSEFRPNTPGPDRHQDQDQQPRVAPGVLHRGPRGEEPGAVGFPRCPDRIRRLCGQLHHPTGGPTAERDQALWRLGKSCVIIQVLGQNTEAHTKKNISLYFLLCGLVVVLMIWPHTLFTVYFITTFNNIPISIFWAHVSYNFCYGCCKQDLIMQREISVSFFPTVYIVFIWRDTPRACLWTTEINIWTCIYASFSFIYKNSGHNFAIDPFSWFKTTVICDQMWVKLPKPALK